jgi:tripartite ATP-independent transporter DctP family solute receptor
MLKLGSSLVIVAMSGLLFVGNLFAETAPGTAAHPIKVRWLIAHEPIDAFRRAAKTFSTELTKESHGQMALEILTPKDFGTSDNMNVKKIFMLLRSGQVELSQTVTTGIGVVEPKFYVLDLPFLFKSHEHASRVLDGEIGHQLLASLDKTKVHGLAFTYSGGFRVVPSSGRAIKTADDFKGLNVRTTNSPVAQETLRLLGAKPIPLNIDDAKSALDSNKVDAAETTYIRIPNVAGENTKFINETHHSLFLTAILASRKFYDSLSQENREALARAAMSAAKIEREDSIADGEKAKADFSKKGVEIVEMSAANRTAFESRVQPVYKTFESMFGKDLIQSIIAQK